MLNERSQAQKTLYFIIPFISQHEKCKTIKKETIQISGGLRLSLGDGTDYKDA